MKQSLKDFLKDVVLKDGYEPTDENIQELLLELDEVSREESHRSRWYTGYDYVVKVDDKFIQFTWYECTGDNSIRDMGLEFDWGKVFEVFPTEVKTIIYVPKIGD